MNLQESIKRILSENNNVILYLLRRYNYNELNNILQNSLQTQSKNLKHYKDKTFNNFNNVVVRSIVETIGEELTDGWVEDLPIPENEIYDFVESLFKDEIKKKYEDLVLNNMNLQESIRRILREETNPLRVMRRLREIHWQIEFAIIEVNVQYNVCGLSEEQYIETVIEKAITSMYWDFFSDMDDSSNEWEKSYKLMLDYASEKFTQHLKNTYQWYCP